MPGRDIPLVTGETYHVFNRGVAGMPIFPDIRAYQRFIYSLHFYLNLTSLMSYSRFIKLNHAERLKLLYRWSENKAFAIELLAYCLMPNHFHLLVRQIVDSGISKVVGNLTNSFTRYVNIRGDGRSGPIFQGKFKAVRIEDEEQFVHIVRYIHLNPLTGYVVKDFNELVDYPYSSFGVYLGMKKDFFLQTSLLLSFYRSKEKLKQFTHDQANYQRSLGRIKHLQLE